MRHKNLKDKLLNFAREKGVYCLARKMYLSQEDILTYRCYADNRDCYSRDNMPDGGCSHFIITKKIK